MIRSLNDPAKAQVLAFHPAQYLATVRRHDVKANIKAIWSMPYDADPILEPECVGLTHGQVILMGQFKSALAGSGDAVDRLLDRMIGKPEQVNKNLNLGGSYKDFLEEVAKLEGNLPADGDIIDAQARSVGPDEPEI